MPKMASLLNSFDMYSRVSSCHIKLFWLYRIYSKTMSLYSPVLVWFSWCSVWNIFIVYFSREQQELLGIPMSWCLRIKRTACWCSSSGQVKRVWTIPKVQAAERHKCFGIFLDYNVHFFKITCTYVILLRS